MSNFDWVLECRKIGALVENKDRNEKEIRENLAKYEAHRIKFENVWLSFWSHKFNSGALSTAK